jgi:hypothetical protein
MAFIGNQPALAYTSFAVQHFTTSATTSYTLNFPVANENEIRLVINNVVQQPGASYAYSASGTTLTLTAATTATDTMYAVFLGKAVQTVNPPNGSVGLSQLSATGTKDSTTFLRGDNTFSTLSTGFTLGTKVTASGTEVSFTGIPSTARMIIINTDGLSLTGAGNPDLKLQLGDSGGIETTGYKATAVYLATNSGEASPGGAGYTDSFVVNYQPDQSSAIHAQIILTCQDTSSNTWNFSNLGSAYSAGYIQCGAGVKSLSATLTQLKLSYSGGQSFDAGTINIMYI